MSYSQERHLFHIVVQDGITYLCMADEVSPIPTALGHYSANMIAKQNWVSVLQAWLSWWVYYVLVPCRNSEGESPLLSWKT